MRPAATASNGQDRPRPEPKSAGAATKLSVKSCSQGAPREARRARVVSACGHAAVRPPTLPDPVMTRPDATPCHNFKVRRVGRKSCRDGFQPFRRAQSRLGALHLRPAVAQADRSVEHRLSSVSRIPDKIAQPLELHRFPGIARRQRGLDPGIREHLERGRVQIGRKVGRDPDRDA